MDELTIIITTMTVAFFLGAGLILAFFPRRQTYVIYATPPTEANASTPGCLETLFAIALLIAAITAVFYLSPW